MQSRNFRLQRVGNLNWLEKNYKFQDISFSLDEIIVLDATKSMKNIVKFAETISNLVNDVFIPIAAGGGIRSVEDAELLFKSGADKLVINTALYENPELIKELVRIYGTQSIIASIDYKIINGNIEVFIRDGTIRIDIPLLEYIKHLHTLKVGEIYLNSIEQDGTGFGYDIGTINTLENEIFVPLIIAGGAGNETHLINGLRLKMVNAVATANLFNFIGDGLPNARKKILQKGINISNWGK